jgi:predicted acylesterase/phospholipase RssA
VPGADFRILSLAGGGFLGLYTALLLEALEGRAGEPLGRRFDLVAGTSIGGILALALAYEVPMARMVRLFSEAGPAVFSSRALPTTAAGRLLDLGRSVWSPKYGGAALRTALEAELGERTLGEALHAVVIPAVDVETCRTKVFKTPRTAAPEPDASLRAVAVALATSAAPTYFPSARAGDRLYADGGLFAVAPDQVALHEAEHFAGVPAERVRMLALGTAARGFRPAEGVREDDGAVTWLASGRLVMTLIAAQQQHVEAMMEDRLGPRYVKLDADWPVEAGLALDVATPQAVETLTRLARTTLERWPEPEIARWVGAAS